MAAPRDNPGRSSGLEPCRDPNLADRVEALLARPRRKLALPEGYSRAAVLALLVRDRDHWVLPLMVRTQAGGPHSGQISFPGGRKEPDDPDAVATALREATEEFGISPEEVRVLGLLDDERTPTGYVVTPVLGCLPALPAFRPDPAEVAEIFTPPLCFFCDPANVEVQPSIVYQGHTYRLYEYVYEGRRIWGLTARILHTLCETLAPNSDGDANHGADRVSRP